MIIDVRCFSALGVMMALVGGLAAVGVIEVRE